MKKKVLVRDYLGEHSVPSFVLQTGNLKLRHFLRHYHSSESSHGPRHLCFTFQAGMNSEPAAFSNAKIGKADFKELVSLYSKGILDRDPVVLLVILGKSRPFGISFFE